MIIDDYLFNPFHPYSPFYQPEDEEVYDMTKQSTELIPQEEKQVATQPAFNLKEAMMEELEGFELEFTEVKVPSGGGLAFEVNEEMVKEITGVIVDHHAVNAYWPNSFDGSKVSPVCTSYDGKIGNGHPGGLCKDCPLNQFGSHPNGGKACKNMYRVYILQEGEAFPLRLVLPPSSITQFKKHLQSIVTKKLRSFGVTTKVTLKKAQNAGGISYSLAQFAVDSVLAPSEFTEMQDYAVGIKSVTRFNHIANNTPHPEESSDLPF